MLATLGDLVEDVVIRVDDAINVASDTAARVARRRGGSAANVAAVAARLGFPARFIGQVGDDPLGAALIADLTADGVDASYVRRGGRTGTIVVLVDPAGERTMLTDRGACSELDRPDPAWLDGVTTLHVPMYSLVGEPLAGTARTLIGWAHDRGAALSIDVSSVALIEALGAREVVAMVENLEPAVVFANEAEAASLNIDGAIGDSITVIKHGPNPAVIHEGVQRHTIPAVSVAAVTDTTGAGDSFAAAFLTADWRSDVVAACRSAHRTAADTVRTTRPR